MRAASLLLGLVLGTFVSQAAQAHGGHHDEPAAAPRGVNAALLATSELSPLCPPGTGHVCSCGNLSLCDARGKAITPVPPAGPRAPAAAFQGFRLVGTAPPHPAPWHSPAAPRAPPLPSWR